MAVMVVMNALQWMLRQFVRLPLLGFLICKRYDNVQGVGVGVLAISQPGMRTLSGFELYCIPR